jgi:RNA polymerase sigma-70 factor (ECF subfamily)
MTVVSGTFRLPRAITGQMPDLANPHAAGSVAQDPSDRDLMRRTAEGDRTAFAVLYQRHSASVYRFARLMTGSGTAAEDVVQEVFLVVMRDASRFDPGRASLASYLYGIARHHTRRRLLRQRRFVALEAGDPVRDATTDTDPASDAVRAFELRQLRRAIVALPSRYREVLVMCDLQDVSYADAASTLGCALGTIRSRLHRARELLKTKMRRAEQSTAVQRSIRCAV